MRRTSTRVGEVDVWIRMVDGQAVNVLQHAVGQDAVQIKGDDNRDFFAQNPSNLLQQVALRISLPLCRHGAMEGEVRRINRSSRAYLFQEVLSQPPKVGSGQSSGRGNGAGAIGGNNLYIRSLRKD